jgi:hypothetical protein
MLPPKVSGTSRPNSPGGEGRSPFLASAPPRGGAFFQPVSDLKTPAAPGLWQLFSGYAVPAGAFSNSFKVKT